MTKIIPTDKARQGHWGRHVLIILIVALMLAAGAWAAAEFYGEAIDPLAAGTVDKRMTPSVWTVARSARLSAWRGHQHVQRLLVNLERGFARSAAAIRHR